MPVASRCLVRWATLARYLVVGRLVVAASVGAAVGCEPADVPTPTEPDLGAAAVPQAEVRFPSIEAVYAAVTAGTVTSVDELIDFLPADYFGHFTLMRQSRSRHDASREYPRVLLFGNDARFLMAIGTDPADPNVDVVEMAQLDRASGLWTYREIDFGGEQPSPSTDDATCRVCHGTPPRPIWGTFPDWIGAFAADGNSFLNEDAIALVDHVLAQPDGGRLRRLRFQDIQSINQQGPFLLPIRRDGRANPVFNLDLSAAVADSLLRRVKHHPDYSQLRWEILERRVCEYEPAGDLFVRLGLDGPNDFQLAHPIAETTPDSFRWNTGTTGLDRVFALAVLVDTIGDDPALRTRLEQLEPDVLAELERVSDLWFFSHGARRDQWLSFDYQARTDLLIPETYFVGLGDALCDYVAQRLEG